MDKIFIFGHKNPDTDSVCGAISLAYLKNKLNINAVPMVLGSINKETEYALNTFKVDVPIYLNDVKIQIKDVNYHKNYLINENSPIIDAFNLMNDTGITGIPLVDDKKYFKGYVSLKEIASDMIYNENLRIETSFENILNVLESDSYMKFDDYIEGYAHSATFSDESFLRGYQLDNETILIIGDRESVIKEAILKKVKLIILVKNIKLSKDMIKLAKENKVNIIETHKSSFKIARVLCLANPIKSIKRGIKTITFNENDYLSDFNEKTSKLNHTNYPIVNNKNICLGMLRTIDANTVKKKKVILVDHNMLGQSVDGLYESDILEIIDHHNIGDINTSLPINFRNMSVGSVNTIIYYLYKENKIKIPQQIAGVMLSGIISDTLMLKSPTTTDKDILVAKELSKIANVNFKKYGLDLLSSGVSIEGATANEIVYRDFKSYKVVDNSFAIGQVFTTDYNLYKNRVSEIVDELNRIEEHNSYKVCVLFVTNFLTNNSYIIYSNNSEKHLKNAFNIENIQEGSMLEGVLSRKKQMVPNIMDELDH